MDANFRRLLDRKITRLNEIFEREHLPYGACLSEGLSDAIAIIDTDNNAFLELTILVSFNGKCSISLPSRRSPYSVIEDFELKDMRDICDCLLELNNAVLVKGVKTVGKSESQSGVTYGQVIEAITKSSRLGGVNQRLIEMIPTNLDGSIYEAIISVVNSNMLGSTVVYSVENICKRANSGH